MVLVFSIILFHRPEKGADPAILSAAFDLSSVGFFYQSSAKEVVLFASRETVKRCPSNEFESVTHMGYHAHVCVFGSGLGVACVTDGDYPSYAGRAIITKAVDLFIAHNPDPNSFKQVLQDKKPPMPLPGLDALLKECQDPTFDKLTAIKHELNETEKAVQKAFEDLLEREESIADLVRRSQDMSLATQTLVGTTKDLNPCCILF